jgi:predicted transport protein
MLKIVSEILTAPVDGNVSFEIKSIKSIHEAGGYEDFRLGIVATFYNKYLIVQMHLNPETVELSPGFIEDYSKKGHWGTGDLRVTLKTPEDFERAKLLIDRAYNEN